jgi:hemerythrin
MTKIRWDESLSVGVDVIDEQHKTWIANYNSVVDAIESQGGPAPITRTLGFLIEYTDMHFETEAGFMRESGYPGMDEHLAKHAELQQTVANLVADYEEEGETAALETAVETFLGNWLLTHIRDTDQLFGAYVRDNDIVLSGGSAA